MAEILKENFPRFGEMDRVLNKGKIEPCLPAGKR
jgi:hypothetical protein